MKINDSKKSSVGTTGKVGNTGAAKKSSESSKAGGTQSAAVSKAGVSVSSSGQIASTLSGDAARRAEKVASLKMEVDSGNYEPDSQKTADKIMQSLTDYSLA